jgi:hypothetical protein
VIYLVRLLPIEEPFKSIVMVIVIVIAIIALLSMVGMIPRGLVWFPAVTLLA